MNLVVKDEEKLEELPLRERTMLRGWDYWDRHDDGFPWRRMYRFLFSRLGRNWDSVIHDFVNTDWVPSRFRTFKKLTKFVEVNTFLVKGKVFYFPQGHTWQKSFSGIAIEDRYDDVYYVHPISKTLQFKPCDGKHKEERRKKYAEETAKTFRLLGDYQQLIKLDGIWYIVWAFPTEKQREYQKPYTPLITKNESNYHPYISPFFDPEYQVLRPKVFKRQLNKKELRHFKVQNDVSKVATTKCLKCGGVDYHIHQDKNQ